MTFSQKRIVIPAKAGIQTFTRGSAEKNGIHVAADAALRLDSRLRGNDEEKRRVADSPSNRHRL
jgi:hypothetical protein